MKNLFLLKVRNKKKRISPPRFIYITNAKDIQTQQTIPLALSIFNIAFTRPSSPNPIT